MSSLWQHKDFMRLWAGQTISAFGSIIGGTALSFTAILVLHASPFQMGVLSAMQLLPAFLTGSLAGAWVDRLRRRPLMIGVDLGRALVLATIPLAALLGALHIVQVYLVALIVSILTIFFEVSYQSYLPTLVGPSEVLEGNSKLTASAAVSEFGGFTLAGWLVQILTAPFAILIDAASFLISALSLGWIRAKEPPVVVEADPNLRREILDGWQEILRQPLLRASGLGLLIHQLGSGIYGALVVLYMSRGLGFSPGLLSTTWAVGGVSAFLGAALAPRLTKRLGLGMAMIVGLGTTGITSLLIPLASGATWISILLMIGAQLGDGFYTLYDINTLSLRQRLASERMLGRVNATMRVLGIGALLVGSLLGGWLGGVAGLRPILFAGAGFTFLATLVLTLSPLRSMKQ